jgi:hypothetical protein
MGKATKTGRLREKTLAEVKHSKQTTFDNLPTKQEKPSQKVEARTKKQIIITEICNETKEDELDLTVGFRLIPSRAAFSKIIAELYFDGQKLHRTPVRISQGPLSANDLELPPVVLDMRGISAGMHSIRVEMYELWNSEEKLNCTSKEATLEYVPVSRQDRFIKIPIVKNPTGAEIEVVSKPEQKVYREIEKDLKKELMSQQDKW